MRFKPRRNRDAGQAETPAMVSDRETLPFPEGGVFGAKTESSPGAGMKASASRRGAGSLSHDLDAVFDEIRSGLDELGDLLDEPFSFSAHAAPDDNGPRRAA